MKLTNAAETVIDRITHLKGQPRLELAARCKTAYEKLPAVNATSLENTNGTPRLIDAIWALDQISDYGPDDFHAIDRAANMPFASWPVLAVDAATKGLISEDLARIVIEACGAGQVTERTDDLVTIFSRAEGQCQACKLTEFALRRDGVKLEVIDIDANPAVAEHLISQGWKAAPIVQADGQTTYAGFKPDRIRSLVASFGKPSEATTPGMEQTAPPRQALTQHLGRTH